MKKIFLPILIATILLSACSTQKPLQNNQEIDFNIDEYSENFELEFEDINTNKIENEVLDTKPKKFGKFEDKNIWFSFLYPDNEKITKNENSSNIRIQNYKYEELYDSVLNAWDFYIEIFYLDNNWNCDQEMWEITSIYENKWTTIYRWFGQEWWDSWWTRYAMCFQKWDKLIYIWYTENWDINVNTIFNSLQIY